jgi:hypothetical protein
VREVVVMADAVDDILHARDFYERIERGVGAYCVQCLWQDIHRLKVPHGVHEVHFGFFRALSEVFPVGIYYREVDERTEVFAVLDLRRSPDWIYRQLTQR